jgi:hypothetical protein
MSAFSEWLATTSGSTALRESIDIYPLVESTHVLTLCVFVGLASILDLRLMGLMLRRVGGRAAHVALDGHENSPLW